MTIGKLTKDEFIDILQHHLSSSSPVQSTELLRGRQKHLDAIEEAFASPGKNIFIYGDRGVGKTSLGQTAAHLHQSADRNPILIACDSHTTFFKMVESIANDIIANPLGGNKSSTTRTKAGPSSIFSVETETKNDHGAGVSAVTDINSAVLLLKHLTERYTSETIVIVDEFDLLRNDDDKEQVANLLKQIGDQKLKLRFIFCGIGQSVEELLGSHLSAHRYLQGIQLEPLIYQYRFEIIDAVAEAMGVEIEKRKRTRIAAISDGFPHYVHLVCEKLFWELFRDPQPCAHVTQDHYVNAVRSAIEAAEKFYQKAYDRATKKDVGDYEEALWAAADHADLQRHNEHIYESYLRVMKEREKEPVDRTKFSAKLNALKSSSAGKILKSTKRNWTEFSENVLRGYVRLRAEAQGIELAQDCMPGKDTGDPWMKAPASKPMPIEMHQGSFYKPVMRLGSFNKRGR
jgi:Cdc6-like AAA superfamily ATPase